MQRNNSMPGSPPSANRPLTACPHLGMPGDPTTVTLFPSDANYCLRCIHPSVPNLVHQAEYCLSPDFNKCPVRQEASTRHLPRALTLKRTPAESRSVALKTGVGILMSLLVALFFLLWMPGVISDMMMSFAPTPVSGGIWPTLTPSVTPLFSATPTLSSPTSTSLALPVIVINTLVPMTSRTVNSIVEKVVYVKREGIMLRSSPTKYYTLIQPITMADEVYLLGRLADNTWLYVHTYEGSRGWIKADVVDLNPKAIVYLPVIEPPPTPFPPTYAPPSATPTTEP